MRHVYFAWFTVGLALIAACSSASHEEPPLEQAQEALSSCGNVTLATGAHAKDEREFAQPTTLVLPASLAADLQTGGLSTIEARFKAKLSNGSELKCTYKRQGGSGPILLVTCTPALAAGQTFVAREIELEIERGPRGMHVDMVFTKVAPCTDSGAGDAATDAAGDARDGGDAATDAARDAGRDAASDAGLDAARDASDAGRDSGIDAGPTCTTASCSDGNACNGVEVCNANGTCSAGTAPVIDDGNACTADSCNPSTGIVHAPVAPGTTCSDGNACNGAETCGSNATCGAGTPPVLDDGNACTIDACNAMSGVSHAPAPLGTRL